MAKKGGILRTVYGVFFALLTLFVGGLFIVQTWSIYRSAPTGTDPYTVERISQHFQEIALPVWVWLGGLVVSITLALLFPSKKARVKAAVDEKKTLERVKTKVPSEGEFFEKAYAVSKRSRAFRAVVWVLTAVFALAATCLCAFTLFDVYYRPAINKPFFQEPTPVVDKIVQVGVLSIAALLVISVAAGIFSVSRKKEQKKYLALIAESKRPTMVEVNAKKGESEEDVPEVEITLSPWTKVIRLIVGNLCFEEGHTDEEIEAEIRKILGECEEVAPVQEEVVAPPTKAKKPLVKAKKEKKTHPKARKIWTNVVRIGLAAAGIALVVLGIFNGGMKDVLLKAINICTQCIGLG